MTSSRQLHEHLGGVAIVPRLAEDLVVDDDRRVRAEDDDVMWGGPFGAAAYLRARKELLHRGRGFFVREPRHVRRRRLSRLDPFIEIDSERFERIARRAQQIRATR